MPITFTTKSYADITMLSDVGNEMLEMMGFGTQVPGAIVAKDLPQALANLQQKLADKVSEADAADNQGQDEADDDKQPPISLTTRAMPLLELLNSSNNSDNDVSWR